ncbi:hypothetical protein MMC07_008185 [Pseudocyphellaria aurata]|nr:hypothetical protein [Pseudocyphellaria aurata]
MSDPSPYTSSSRMLHIYTEGFRGRRMNILDSDKSTPVYIVNKNSGGCFSSKPHMRFCRPPTPQSPLEVQIGSASFHTWSRSVDLDFGSSTSSLSSKGVFTRSTEFQSSVGLLTWKHDTAFGNDLRLVNAEGNWLARFVGNVFAWKKRGSLEISPGVNFGPGLLDEIVISGLAMVEAERRRRNANSAAAGSAGGSVAVSS